MPLPMPLENTFDHLRKPDGEHVGYIHMTDDGEFVPFDLLHRRRSEATDWNLPRACSTIWVCGCAGAIAKSADMTKTFEVPLPTGMLFQGHVPPADQ